MAFPYKLYGGATRPDAISGLQPEFSDALLRLYNNAPPDVQAELGLNSAFRSIAVQRRLYENSDRSGRTVAAPGKSQHNFGRAADLYGFGLQGTPTVSQATRDWVHANAGKYGLNFPMNYEPWHIQLANAQAQDMAQKGYSPEQIKAAFLTTIASGESPGYDVMYGGKKFTDYSRHPHAAQTAGGITSDVAGRYQFKGSTWDELQKKYGYKDFSPASQDAAAWQYAGDIFKQKTGGSLEEALASGDPARINAAAQVLNQTWSSLPGGAEQAKGYGQQSFADIYNRALNAAGGTGVHPPQATVGTDSTAVAANAPLPFPDLGKARQKTAGEVFGEGIAKMGAAPEPATSLPGLARPQISMSLLPSAPFVDPQQNEMRRQNLAALMARLNAGGLWG